MPSNLRAVVLNAQPDYARRLRGHLMVMDGLKIAGEINDPHQYVNAPARFRADVAIIDLDPEPQQMLEQATAVVQHNRDCNVFAISKSDDPRLILSCVRAGLRDCFKKPLDHEDLAAAFEKVAAQKQSVTKFGKLVTVVGSCGGVGTSMLAVNLACEFAQISADKVGLIDLDYDFGMVCSLLDVAPSFTILDLASGTEKLEAAVVERALTKHSSGVAVLARPHEVGQAANIAPEQVNSIIASLQESFDFVVIDGPLRYDPSLRGLLDHADAALVVVNLSISSMRGADRVMQQLGREGFNLDRVGLVLNRVGKETGGISVEHVEQALNREVFWQIPEDAKTASSSLNLGEPLVTFAPQSKLRASIRDLAQVIHNPSSASTEEEKKRVGFLSRMFTF